MDMGVDKENEGSKTSDEEKIAKDIQKRLKLQQFQNLARGSRRTTEEAEKVWRATMGDDVPLPPSKKNN